VNAGPGAGKSAPTGLVFVAASGLFFLSGGAGLVYQVLWMRLLALFLGSDVYGASIILASFMGGLALGSLVGGRLSERTRRPLAWYGAAEIGIGLYALALPGLFAAAAPLLHAVYPEDPGDASFAFQTVRMLLAAGSLVIPTTLMGATLPLIMRQFARNRATIGGTAAHFYALNTLGAVVGTIAAGFALLPYLGTRRSVVLVAVVNLAIGALCIALGRRASLPAPVRAEAPCSAEAGAAPERRRVARAALLALALSGMASFALELVWTRVLVLTFSATAYAFAAMLACFLSGIFLGSLWIANRVDLWQRPLRILAVIELAIGLSVAILGLLLDAVPGVFGSVFGRLVALLSEAPGPALALATLLVSFVLLIVPTTLIGTTFPVALRAYTTSIARVGSRTGNLYFANTAGSIVGALGAGLVLVPLLGARTTLAGVALLFAGIGLWLLRVEPTRLRPPGRAAVAGALVVTLLATATALSRPYRVTLNLDQRADARAELLYHAEGIHTTVDVVRSADGATSLVLGGNVEADDTPVQMRHFVLKGHLPLLTLDEPGHVLVVGLGMGITLAATARHEGVEQIDVIELLPEVLGAHAVLGEINGGVVSDPLVRIRIDDGRTYMRMTDARYDMITADPIHPKVSRVGYLYTREYYEAIRERLAPGGIVCQWMPIYQISPTRLRSAVKTFAAVFPDATLWYVKNHALLLAKLDEGWLDYAQIARNMRRPRARADLASIGIETPEELLSLLLMGPEEIRAYVAAEPGVPLNTDDHPYLEYFVPADLFFGPLDNVRELVKHMADPADLVRGLPPSARARLELMTRNRGQRLLAELEGRGRRPAGAHGGVAPPLY
jgi:spermidine synthase